MLQKTLPALLFAMCFTTTTNAQNPDHATAEANIEKTLKEKFGKVEVNSHKFYWDAIDLNGDGKNEYLVGLTGLNWCGADGCTLLVLNDNYALNTQTSMIQFPVYVGAPAEGTKGWANLYSGPVKLAYNGKRYPANTSIAPSVERPKGASKLLDVETETQCVF